jgi:hypothetical protein
LFEWAGKIRWFSCFVFFLDLFPKITLQMNVLWYKRIILNSLRR